MWYHSVSLGHRNTSSWQYNLLRNDVCKMFYRSKIFFFPAGKNKNKTKDKPSACTWCDVIAAFLSVKSLPRLALGMRVPCGKILPLVQGLNKELSLCLISLMSVVTSNFLVSSVTYLEAPARLSTPLWTQPHSRPSWPVWRYQGSCPLKMFQDSPSLVNSGEIWNYFVVPGHQNRQSPSDPVGGKPAHWVQFWVWFGKSAPDEGAFPPFDFTLNCQLQKTWY